MKSLKPGGERLDEDRLKAKTERLLREPLGRELARQQGGRVHAVTAVRGTDDAD